MTLLRAHVRAIDNSEDDLLRVYLDAALDYMEQLTNRVLGLSDVVVYVNREELKRPFPVHKVQDVVRLWKLEYRSEDADGASPWSKPYKMYESTIDHEINSVKISGLSETHFPMESNDQTAFLLYLTLADRTNVTLITADLEMFDEATGQYVNDGEDQVVANTFPEIGVLLHTPTGQGHHHPKGFYRYKVVVTANDEGTTTSYLYFQIHNGTDFDNVIVTDRYPCYFDLSKYEKAIGEDNIYTSDEADFARIYMIAGTELASLPKQYKQAALLLVGHYYNMREAENIGGITTEVKEGVHRLLQSVRQF